MVPDPVTTAVVPGEQQSVAVAASSAPATALTAIPSASPMRASNRARSTAVKDGKIVAKFFNMVAGRPYPPIGTLTDVITVQMNVFTQNFLTTSTLVPVYAGLTYQLSSFSGFNRYTALFDQYRIEQIEVWIEPASAPAANISYPEVASAVDLDDGNVPTGIGNVSDRPGALVGLGISGRYHKWKPFIATAAYSGVFTSFTNVVAPWIDSGSTNVQHYGLKVAASISSSPVQFNLVARARVSFRAPGIA